MTNSSTNDIVLLPLEEETCPQELQSLSNNLSYREKNLLSGILPQGFFQEHKIYDMPFEILKHPIPLSLLSEVFKISKNQKHFKEQSPRQKQFFEMFSKFCFVNRKSIPFEMVKSWHENLYGHSIFHVFKHVQCKKDVLLYASQINTLPNPSDSLAKSLIKASLNNPKSGIQGIKVAQGMFSKDEILDEIMPQLSSAELLKDLFGNKFLNQKDATDPRLIGPFLIKNKDELLNILHDHAKKDFVPSLIKLHHEKRGYPLPYISRNLKRFKSDPALIDIIEATQHRWVNQHTQQNFDEQEFVVCLEKSLMQKETLYAKEKKASPASARKM